MSENTITAERLEELAKHDLWPLDQLKTLLSAASALRAKDAEIAQHKEQNGTLTHKWHDEKEKVKQRDAEIERQHKALCAILGLKNGCALDWEATGRAAMKIANDVVFASPSPSSEKLPERMWVGPEKVVLGLLYGSLCKWIDDGNDPHWELFTGTLSGFIEIIPAPIAEVLAGKWVKKEVGDLHGGNTNPVEIQKYKIVFNLMRAIGNKPDWHDAKVLSSGVIVCPNLPTIFNSVYAAEQAIQADMKMSGCIRTFYDIVPVDSPSPVAAETQAATPLTQPVINHSSADDLRIAGWSVAVHNDYRLNGERFTFWLFTQGDLCVKGEGRTDTEALNIVRKQLRMAQQGVEAARKAAQ